MPGTREESSQGAIAVVIPCLNEAAAISQVVDDFRAALPSAQIYVYDNASTDNTAAVAAKAGALVRSEPVRGKGNVVRRMFSDTRPTFLSWWMEMAPILRTVRRI